MDARILRNGAAFTGLALMALALSAFPSSARQQQQDSQQSTGDPVADAARKAREQKKDAVKPKRVITDDDVNHLVSGSAPAAGDAATEEGAAKKPGAEGKDAAGKTAVLQRPAESPCRAVHPQGHQRQRRQDCGKEEGNRPTQAADQRYGRCPAQVRRRSWLGRALSRRGRASRLTPRQPKSDKR